MVRGRFDAIRMNYFTVIPNGTESEEYPAELNADFKWPRWSNGDSRDIDHIEAVVGSILNPSNPE